MVGPTQLAGLQDVEARLPACEAEVLGYLREHPFKTRNEIDRALGDGRPNCQASRRLAQMERRGVIARANPRPCGVTGRNCETWYPTGRVAQAVAKAAPARKRLEKLVADLLDMSTGTLFLPAGAVCKRLAQEPEAARKGAR